MLPLGLEVKVGSSSCSKGSMSVWKGRAQDMENLEAVHIQVRGCKGMHGDSLPSGRPAGTGSSSRGGTRIWERKAQDMQD
jgi:hypothetical protein